MDPYSGTEGVCFNFVSGVICLGIDSCAGLQVNLGQT